MYFLELQVYLVEYVFFGNKYMQILSPPTYCSLLLIVAISFPFSYQS